MGSENRSISRYETTAVYTHPEAKADIVLVHGLNGSPEKTWTKNGVFWPVDLLPSSLRETHANILVYGYNADVYSKRNDRSASDNFIHNHAQTLIANLTLFRKDEGTFKNPIIWVAHSLGGVLVKRALLYSNDLRGAHIEEQRSIYVSTFGIIFLGTPHTGSDAAKWGLRLQAMSDSVVLRRFFDSESVLLKTLKKDNETLSNINSHFLDIYQRFRIHMAHENHKTDIRGSKMMIVDTESASPQLPGVTYYGIEATHSGMCKFEDKTSPGYRSLSAVIRMWVRDAVGVIQVRWEVEEGEQRARAQREVIERIRPYVEVPALELGGSVEYDPLTTLKDQTTTRPLLLGGPEPWSPTVDEPLFIHPERFRPNSSFKGRRGELSELHRMLMDHNRRGEGTSAVLVWSVPGGGKSHLVREYAFKHRHEYPGGVFWVRAKSQEDLDEGFLKIARNNLVREGLLVEDDSDLHDPQKAVRLVRKWFNRSEQWLLILDGVLFDMPHISRYIPYARNTSLILTSTDTSIAGNHIFNNPQKLELGPLDETDAQEMLLEEMDKKKPWTQEDLSRALEAVQLMKCFPLAIHAAAQQLRATKEPLQKYNRSYKNQPRTGGLDAYKAVRAKLQERGEMAALNLIYLLSFFNERIPVEMLALGIKALDKRTPVLTHGSSGQGSLNKTFTVLIAFALIDRDEIDDISSASIKSSEPSRVMHEPLDVLQIHGLVQSFFLEKLRKENQFLFWLERAAAVFCRSYDEGDLRVQRNPDRVGIPDDYRRYSNHCRRLLEHINKVDKPTQALRVAKQALKDRLEKIQGQIATLTTTRTTASTDHYGDAPHISVFERNNSFSISNSTATTESWDNIKIPRQLTFPDQHDGLSSSPHDWHKPYPDDSTIPTPGLEDYENYEDGLIQVPEPQPPVSLEPYRTLRRSGYNDKVGAWRESQLKATEPRTSVSREVVQGKFSPGVHSASQVGSSPRESLIFALDAEQQLHQIKNSNQWVPSDGSPQAAAMARLDSKERASQQSIPSIEENPFFPESNQDAISGPFMSYGIPDWRPPSSNGGAASFHSTGNHSESCLGAEAGRQFPPGLPVSNYERSSLTPAPGPHHHQQARHRATDSGLVQDSLSNSLPNVHGMGLLHPLSWRPAVSSGTYIEENHPSTSDPQLAISQHSSPVHSTATSQTLPIKTHRAPSMVATEPSPRLPGFDVTSQSSQAYQVRHPRPWSPASSGSPFRKPGRPHSGEFTDAEAADMVRSGSGGIQFNGKIVQFGQSPPRGAPYPQKIMETDEEIMDMTETPTGLGIIQEHRGKNTK